MDLFDVNFLLNRSTIACNTFKFPNVSTIAKLREASPAKKQEKSIDDSSESGEVNAADYIPVQKEIIIG